jgi:hypothetical protein
MNQRYDTLMRKPQCLKNCMHARTDEVLNDWLQYQSEHGSNFMRSLAELAQIADLHQFEVLRPVLLQFKVEAPDRDESRRPGIDG